MGGAVMWFRRDLRLHDHPALQTAADSGDLTLLYVLDPAIPDDTARARRLRASVAELHAATHGSLVIRTGDPAEVVPQVAREARAGTVHVSAETTPFGSARDERVEQALGDGVELVRTGSPYAVTPGRVTKGDRTQYLVFTPFHRAWREHGWRQPAGDPPRLPRRILESEDPPERMEGAGEEAALERWKTFRQHHLAGYAEGRDRPDLDSTSRLSIPLKYGEIHPRTLLADLAGSSAGSAKDRERFEAELCWREFYADVLHHRPQSLWRDLNATGLTYDTPSEELVDAWREGRTGFPFVDAGMRQLHEEGWMHNRVRMVTASFFAKDLHAWWPVGAKHFLDHLQDGDMASNNHGWQWTAGTGTDAAPYFRVFNPVLQGLKFDPDGEYVRRWVPELRHLSGKAAHEPWKADGGYDEGYPQPVVDHADERQEALRRFDDAKDR